MWERKEYYHFGAFYDNDGFRGIEFGTVNQDDEYQSPLHTIEIDNTNDSINLKFDDSYTVTAFNNATLLVTENNSNTKNLDIEALKIEKDEGHIVFDCNTKAGIKYNDSNFLLFDYNTEEQTIKGKNVLLDSETLVISSVIVEQNTTDYVINTETTTSNATQYTVNATDYTIRTKKVVKEFGDGSGLLEYGFTQTIASDPLLTVNTPLKPVGVELKILGQDSFSQYLIFLDDQGNYNKAFLGTGSDIIEIISHSSGYDISRTTPGTYTVFVKILASGTDVTCVVVDRVFDGGDSNTASYSNSIDGGTASTTTFNTTIDGGNSLTTNNTTSLCD